MIKQCIKILSLAAMVFTVSTAVHADTGAVGSWKTESSDRGYLHVKVEQCGKDMCGTILQAFDLSDEPLVDYEHIGKNMIWDMSPKGETSWAGGKIWDPSEDKTYKSKMTVKGDVLSVSGCIIVFCKSQLWTRI